MTAAEVMHQSMKPLVVAIGGRHLAPVGGAGGRLPGGRGRRTANAAASDQSAQAGSQCQHSNPTGPNHMQPSQH